MTEKPIYPPMQSPSRLTDEAAGVFVPNPYPDEADHPVNIAAALRTEGSTKTEAERTVLESSFLEGLKVSDDDFDEPLGTPNQCKLDDPGCESCQ